MGLFIQAQSWHWYSPEQAVAAALFVRLCGAVEAQPEPPSADEAQNGLTYSLDAMRQHRSYATAAVFASVAFLEASVNELFASAPFPNLEVGGKLAPAERSVLKSMAPYLDRLPTLDRFQAALHLLGREPFEEGANPYQDTRLVVHWRNALVHYQPRWHGAGPSVDTDPETSFEGGLRAKGLAENPLTGPGNPFFPDRSLSHGYVRWAWNAALSFGDEFFGRVGVDPPYEATRPDFKA